MSIFTHIGRERVFPARRYRVRGLGIDASGTWQEWLNDLLAAVAVWVIVGLIALAAWAWMGVPS